MESENKKDITLEIQQMMKEWENKEKMYIELPKDKLVDRLILCEMELASEKAEPVNMMELWYYVSDWTGVKYLTNEEPQKYMVFNKATYMSDGEVNIRVPKCMESLFPNIKYEDEPVKVKITADY